ncbi:MAG TPA: NADH-quinone oxidoreductase subunit L [Actinomycetales bacterium]|nr:NADH-quinone oxidoreductase subunit L [Actinomycetales bacterium]
MNTVVAAGPDVGDIAWAARFVVVLPALAALAGAVVPRQYRTTISAVGVGGALAALLAAVTELAGTGGSTVAHSVALLGPAPTGAGTIDLTLRADRLSAVVAVMVCVVALAVQVYSVAYQCDDQRYRAFASVVSLFTAAMLLVVQADDLLLLLIGWEVMGLCSYLLIGHDSERRAARHAAVKAFLVTRMGDVGFVLGIVTLLAAADTSSVSRLLEPGTLERLSTAQVTAASLLLIAGVVGKSAQLPLQTWLPDAMEGPTPVSALIHAATMVAAGGYVLARLLPVLAQAPAARAVLAVVACASMLAAALAAFAQSDLKRVLAWSTISQVAYLLAGIAVAPPDLGAAPAVMQLLSHAAFKSLLFLCAGALAYRVHTTAMGRVADGPSLAGSWARSPVTSVLLTVGLAALAGVPPLSGFWSKEAVLGAAEVAALDGGVDGAGSLVWAGWLVLVVGLVTGFVTAAYATRAWMLVVPSPADVPAESSGAQLVTDDSPPAELLPSVPRRDPLLHAAVPPAMSWTLLGLAVPTVLAGLLLIGPVVPGAIHLSSLTGALATTLALAGIVAAGAAERFAGRRVPGGASAADRRGDPVLVLPAGVRAFLAGGFGLDAVHHALVVAPTRLLARGVTVGDHDVVDAYPRGGALLARWAGVALRLTQTGRTTGYLGALAAGAVVVALAGVGLR